MAVRFQRLFVLVLLFSLLLAVSNQSTARQVVPPAPDASGQEAVSEPVWRIDASPEYTGCGGDIAPVVNASYEQQVVELVNAVRADNGVPPLKRSEDLDDAARYYSTDMGQDDYSGSVPQPHDTYDRSGGTLVWVCDAGTRIAIYYTPSYWGENIAATYSTPQVVMDAWMNSPLHKANILSTNFREIGVGYYSGSGTEAPYWTQDFGRQNAVYPVIINGEAATTNSTSVSLYVYGSGDWDEMRLRNDSGSWTAWQSFQSTLSWTLNPGAGQHTVCVELRKGAETVQACDSIELRETTAHFSYLPTVLKDVSTGPVTGWITIVAEDFEGDFPGAWQVTDYGSGTGDYYWGKRGCRSYAGSNSGWAVGGGANGAALGCGSNYPNDVYSFMVYGPFSLADATAADLTFQLFLYSESQYDYVYHGASINGNNFYGDPPASGDSGGWVQRTLDLTAVPTLGDLTGQPAVWIALIFNSDETVNYPEGAYVDNIVLRKYVPAKGQSAPVEPESGPEALGQTETWILKARADMKR